MLVLNKCDVRLSSPNKMSVGVENGRKLSVCSVERAKVHCGCVWSLIALPLAMV